MHNILVGRLCEKRHSGGLTCVWENNIKIDVGEVGCDDVEWMELAHSNVH